MRSDTGIGGREASLAVEIVGEAVRLARAIERQGFGDVLGKSDASPVTVADFSVQALVAAQLARHFPDDALVAEEDSQALRGAHRHDLRSLIVDIVSRAVSGADADAVLKWIDRGTGAPGQRFWTLDPIDGTKGLLRGGQYAIALALVVDGTVQIGVLGCPHLSLVDRSAPPASTVARGEGGIAAAVRGQGAWWHRLDGTCVRRLRTSVVADTSSARVVHSVEAQHSDEAELERVLSALRLSTPPIRMDSQAKHAVVAGGGADLMLRFPPRPGFRDAIWDQAAGSLLIEEAGGRVTDLAGRPLDFSSGRRLEHNEGLIASNGALHDAVMAALVR